MVMRFFQGSGDPLERIEREVIEMVGSCRHSFDLAMGALVSDADITLIGDEVRATDRAINGVEETVRRELVVHISVRGGEDVGSVLSFLLVVKKLERVGDQAKNIFDLAGEGVRFSGAPDYERFAGFRKEISDLFAQTITLVADLDEADPTPMLSRCQELMDGFDALVNSLIHSDEPGKYAVPRAMLFRYLKRIVANLSGTISTLTEGVDRKVDLDE